MKSLILLLIFAPPLWAARNFTPANDEINWGNNYNATGDFSAAVWIKPTDDGDADVWLARKDGFANNQIGWLIGTGSADASAVRVADGVDGASCVGSADLDGIWTHLAITWDNTAKVLTLYENGVVVCSSTSFAISSASNSENLTSGESSSGGDDANGLVAFAEVWVGKVLTEVEMLQAMRFPGSVTTAAQADHMITPIWGNNDPESSIDGNGVTGDVVAGSDQSLDGPPVSFP